MHHPWVYSHGKHTPLVPKHCCFKDNDDHLRHNTAHPAPRLVPQLQRVLGVLLNSSTKTVLKACFHIQTAPFLLKRISRKQRCAALGRLPRKGHQELLRLVDAAIEHQQVACKCSKAQQEHVLCNAQRHNADGECRQHYHKASVSQQDPSVDAC